MKSLLVLMVCIVSIFITGCTMSLKMQQPKKLSISDIERHNYTAGLYVPQKVKDAVHIQITSPFDRLSYPIGKQTYETFKTNLPLVFKNIEEVDSVSPTKQVDIIIKPSITQFHAVIPVPAYNPHTATITYKVDVYNKTGEMIYTQTTTGNAQTSKGLMSGFFGRRIPAQAAQMAIDDAIQQVVEGLSDAEELENP